MKNLLMVATCALLIGCATLTPEQQAALQVQANRPVLCSAGPDCEQKWSRAVQWVRANSAYKFQSATDLLIQTMGPLPDDPRPAFTVTRVATGNGTYLIDFGGGCDNLFGCIPSMLESKANFVAFVMQP